MGTSTMFLGTSTSLGTVTTTSNTCVNEDRSINKKGVVASIASTTAVTATNCIQEISYRRVINDASAYMEAMSDEELDQLITALDKKQKSLNSEEACICEESIRTESIQKVKTK